MREETFRILASDVKISNDTWKTGINNNDLIIGTSGCGKTRGYVMPNILCSDESMIIADTKGNLRLKFRSELIRKDYKIININFKDLIKSNGYNPLDYIRYNSETDKYSEQDIMTVSSCLVPSINQHDPFWDLSAKFYIEAMIAYVLEMLPKNEHNLLSVVRLFAEMNTGKFKKLFKELGDQDPDSFAYNRYQLFHGNEKAEKTYESIRAVIASNISTLCFDGAKKLFLSQRKINLTELGKKKVAVFLNISDTDRSMDKLINLFYTQALQVLCNLADSNADNRLEVPVRFFLDDFAANVVIPDFDKIVSVIRSREIYVSVILQSLSQLESQYGREKSMTIINNCDNLLYLGGNDVNTARYIGIKANKSTTSILNMPLDKAYLFTRGQEPRLVNKYVPCSDAKCV